MMSMIWRFSAFFLLGWLLLAGNPAAAAGPFTYRFPVGTSVLIIYEPVKIGFLQGRTYVEVHEDIYAKIPDMLQYAMKRLQDGGLAGRINWLRFLKAMEEQTGAPVDISR